MIKQDICIDCGGPLGEYGASATKKFINRGAQEYCCLDCLAKRFNVTTERLEEKILYFRKQGCTLFPPIEKE